MPSHRHRPNRHIGVDDSGQALPRHPQYLAYRCFLPDLAGFARLRRVGPNLQYRQPLTAAHQPGLKRGIQPRYSGLRVQGTASSPSSTISVTMVGEQGFTVNRSTFLVVSQLTGTGVVIHSSYRPKTGAQMQSLFRILARFRRKPEWQGLHLYTTLLGRSLVLSHCPEFIVRPPPRC